MISISLHRASTAGPRPRCGAETLLDAFAARLPRPRMECAPETSGQEVPLSPFTESYLGQECGAWKPIPRGARTGSTRASTRQAGVSAPHLGHVESAT